MRLLLERSYNKKGKESFTMRLNSKVKSTARKILAAMLVMALTYAIMALVLRAIGLENAQHYVHQAGIWSPVLFVLLCAASLIIAPLSGSSLYIMGGALFGKETSLLLSYIATLLGCSANFWISRKLGRRVASRFIGRSHLEELDQFTDRIKHHHSVFYMVILMPLSQDIVSYAIGLTKVRYSVFLLALAISGLLIVGAYIYLGTSLLEQMI